MPEGSELEFKEIVAEVELSDIRCFEIHAKAAAGFESTDADATEDEGLVDLRIEVKQSKETLIVRVRADLASREVETSADIAAIYNKPRERQYSEDAVNRFVREVAMFTVHPFLREAVADATRRVGVVPHMLGLLRRPIESLDDSP